MSARIWIMSDLHLDASLTPFYLPDPRPEHDIVVIAGDICEDMVKGVHWIANAGFVHPVVYVGGNHEFYRTSRDRNLEKAVEAARGSHIHILQDSHVDIGGVRFVGATLWTDYALMGDRKLAMLHATNSMNDHRLISLAAKGYRRWLPNDAAHEHDVSRAYIRSMLWEPFAGPRVVVTHHAPSLRSCHPHYRGDLLNAAYASDLEAEVDRASLWVHGHVHARHDYGVGDGRVICNPRGYVGYNEHTGFDPALVVTL